jgi:hypothetical protein
MYGLGFGRGFTAAGALAVTGVDNTALSVLGATFLAVTAVLYARSVYLSRRRAGEHR